MKKALCLSLMLAAPLAAENLFKNSTMDTAGAWKGSKKFVKESDSDNRVLVLDAKSRDKVSFSQEVDTRGLSDVVLKFRYRTTSYKGRGLELRGIRMDRGSTFRNLSLTADGQWHEVSWDFTQIRGSGKIDFQIILLEGDGEVAFDDVTVQKK